MIDPYRDPKVIKRMQELQQKKYRQGHRTPGAKDSRGNPIYVLTEDEKISCLDPDMQNLVRDELAKKARLDSYAAPFRLTIGVGNFPPSYILQLHGPGDRKARRDKQQQIVDTSPNPEAWFKAMIDEMKHELMMGDSLHTLHRELEVHVDKMGSRIVDKRVKKKAPALKCPDHDNILVPGEELGTLVCTVLGCKKKARRKNKDSVEDAAPVETQDEAPKKNEDVLKVDDILDIELSQPVRQMVKIENIQDVANIRFPVRVHPPGQYYQPNDSPVRLVMSGGRYYLSQLTPHGEVHIDVTTTQPNYTVKAVNSGLTEATLVLIIRPA